MVVKTEPLGLANHHIQFSYWHDLGNGQLANRQDELWFEKLYFVAKPIGAIIDFFLIWHPITAARILAGKTTTHCGHIDFVPKARFFQADTGKPAKQCLAGCPGKRAMHLDFPVARRLADQ